MATMSSLVDQLGPLGISNSALESGEILGAVLSAQLVHLRDGLTKGNINKSVRTAAERYIAGADHLKNMSRGSQADVHGLETCLSKNRWQQIRTQVVRNALRSDLYFLPADGNGDVELSPVAKHSVVLFRYPLTVPVSVLDAAQDSSLNDWDGAVASLGDEEPIARAFLGSRPLKCLRLQSRFLADLLTKFVNLYSRIGSPDFTRETVEAFSNELGEQE